MRKMKICIYSLDTYQLLTESKQNYIGGAELQASLLGKELSKQKDIEVSFVVFDDGQSSHEIVNDVHIYKTKPRTYLIENSGFLPLLNIMFLNWRILKTINSDLYYTRGSGKYTGLIALFCLLRRKKFILGMASDKDIDGSFESSSKFYEKYSFLFAIKFASCIISQNNFQKIILKKRFGKNSTKINNANHIPTYNAIKKSPPTVIWVGTIKPEWKQPKLFVKLAQAIPEANFQMIGGPSSDIKSIQLYEEIKQLASQIPNLELVGFVPYNKIDKYYDEASILVNTSSIEGFPNTFIEAWMRYVPVVSLNINPDGIINENNLGYHSKTFEKMVEDVNNLLYNHELRVSFGNNARNYAEKNYDIKNTTALYLNIIYDLINSKRDM